MTTATKIKPTRTREEELAEELEQHRGQVATLERQASELDQVATDLDARAEAKILSLDGPLTKLPDSIDDDRNLALLKRQRANDLRKRAQAYAARVELQAITAEHDQLRQERIAKEQFEAATEEAKALTAEAEIRAAWLFRSHIATEAVKRRYDEITQRLVELAGDTETNVVVDQRHPAPDRPAASRARPSIDLHRFTTLGNDVQRHAGQYVQAINREPDPDFWRRNLPELEPLELPEELRPITTVIAGPHIDQVGVRTFDPDIPKDRAMRLAAGAKPLERNPDGTPLGSLPINVVLTPRTEREDRARRAAIAETVEAEDRAVTTLKDGA